MKSALFLGLLAFALNACSDKQATAPKTKDAPKQAAEAAAGTAPAKPAGHPIWGTYDLAAEAKRLEGKWSVRAEVGKERQTWEVKGDKVTITKADGTVELGTIFMPVPGELAVKKGDATHYNSYARTGADTYVGLGRSGLKIGDKYFVRASRGLVVFDGKTCVHHREKMVFGKKIKEFEDAKPVKCELQAGGGKAVLHYQVPKFMKDGEFDDYQIAVVGEALINDQLNGHKIEAVE